MRLTAGVMLLAVLLGPAAAAAQQGARSERAKQKAQSHDLVVHGEVSVVFSTGDVKLIREHYAPQYRNLPPGLYKKLGRTGTLPPGWHKKLQPFPVALERRLTPIPDGYHRGTIDGQAVIYSPKTGVIIDVTVLF